MMEVAFGLGTLAAWLVGLWFYPRCLEDTADFCEDVCMFRPRNNLIIDEAQVEYHNHHLHSSSSTSLASFPSQSSLNHDATVIIATAKLMEIGDAPLFHSPSSLPHAKVLKIR